MERRHLSIVHGRRLLRCALSYMLERRVMLHATHVHIWLWSSSLIALISDIILVIVIISTLVCEVLRSLVFMRTAIVLETTYYIIYITRRVFVEFLVVAKDYNGDIDLAKDG